MEWDFDEGWNKASRGRRNGCCAPSFTPLVEIEPSRQHQTTTKERRDVDANFLHARASSLWTRLLRTHTLLFSFPLSSRETIVISTNSCSPRRLNKTRNTLKSRSCLNTTVSIVRSRSRNRRHDSSARIKFALCYNNPVKIVRGPRLLVKDEPVY